MTAHLNYGGIIYDLTSNTTFHQKMEAMQYNAAWAIIGAKRDSSKEKLYLKLGSGTLQQRRWFRKSCFFYKILKLKSPRYLYKLVLVALRSYRTRHCDKIPLFNIKYNFFRNSLLPSSIIEWNNLETDITNSESIWAFKKQFQNL